jgi:deoxyribodipyrimidine photolyase-related protein
LKEIDSFFKGKKHYHQTDFYIYQRKRLNILIDEDHSPLGGKWTFDGENRKKLPKEINLPKPLFPEADNFLKKAIEEVGLNFKDLPGFTTLGNGIYPWAWTREQAQTNLHHFLQFRFFHFGEYEDAIAKDEHFIFHSLLSPSINIGLITPKEVIDAALDFSSKNRVVLLFLHLLQRL